MRDVIRGDRRKWQRHAYQLDLQFEHQDQDGTRHVGHGVTADLCRGAVRFWSDDPLAPGVEAVTRIPWPFLLQNMLPLELVLKGSVTAVTGRGTIFAIKSYEFRTCGPRSFWEEPEASSNWKVA